MKSEPSEHPFSWNALGRIVLVLVMIVLVVKTLPIFVNFLISIIVATAIYPLVEKLNKKLPTVASIVIVLLIFIIPFALIATMLIPNLLKQLPDIVNTAKMIMDHISFLPQSVKNFDLNQFLNQHLSELLASSTTIFLALFSIGTIFVAMFYFLFDHKRLVELLLNLFPNHEQGKIRGTLTELARVNGQYIRGNLLISLICSIVTLIYLLILGIPFAIPLAIFAGIFDLLPLVGSTIGAIPSVIIAFALSPIKGIILIVLHLVYQEIENDVLSPAIYNKALQISPLISFLSVIIGAELLGITGAFLALPVAASIPTLINYVHGYRERRKQKIKITV